MFNKLDFGNKKKLNLFSGSTQRESKAPEILKKLIYDQFGVRNIEQGITGIYLIMPYETEKDYSAEEKRELGRILREAAKAKKITSAYINTIVWVAEYDLTQEACLGFFPVDRSLVMEIDDVAAALKTSRVIRLT